MATYKQIKREIKKATQNTKDTATENANKKYALLSQKKN